jgi:DNA-binding NtrC family response regulator
MLAGRTAEALNKAGYQAIAMTNAMTASQKLEVAQDIELLITSADFPGRQPNGLALARMTRQRRPNLKAIYVNGPDTEPHVRSDGAFIPTPTTPEPIVQMADRMMKTGA